MITALIIRGVTLPGAYKGIEHYTLKLNTEALFKLQVNFLNYQIKNDTIINDSLFKTWIDAINQVFFCLGISK